MEISLPSHKQFKEYSPVADGIVFESDAKLVSVAHPLALYCIVLAVLEHDEVTFNYLGAVFVIEESLSVVDSE